MAGLIAEKFKEGAQGEAVAQWGNDGDAKDETVGNSEFVIIYCDFLQNDEDLVNFGYNIEPDVIEWPGNQQPPIVPCSPNTEELKTQLIANSHKRLIVILPGKGVANLNSLVTQCINSDAQVIVHTGNPRDYASSVRNIEGCQIVDKGDGPESLRGAIQSAINQLQQKPTTLKQLGHEVADDGMRERDRSTAPQVLIIDTSQKWVELFQDATQEAYPDALCTVFVSRDDDLCLEQIKTTAWDLVILPFAGVFDNKDQRQHILELASSFGLSVNRIMFASGAIYSDAIEQLHSEGFGIINKDRFSGDGFITQVKSLFEESEAEKP